MQSKSITPSESLPLDSAGVEVYDYMVESLERDGTEKPPEALMHMHVRGYRNSKNRKADTYDKLKEVISLRKKHELDSIMEKEWNHKLTEKDCNELWSLKVYGQDPEGHPIVFDKCGCMEKKLVKEHFLKDEDGKKMLMDYYFRFCEKLDKIKAEKTKRGGKMLYQHVMVIDVAKAGIGDLSLAKKVIGDLITLSQKLYPESLKKMYIVNAGWLFQAAFKIVSIFLDKETEQKIAMHGKKWHKELAKDGIQIDQIPQSWGGKGDESVSDLRFN